MGPDVNHFERSARKGRFGRTNISNNALRKVISEGDASLFVGAIVIKATRRRREGCTEYLMYHPDFYEVDIGDPVPVYRREGDVWVLDVKART